MGVEEFDPRVTHQLLELMYRYVSTVLTEARVYSEHADKTMIDAEDVKLAVRTRSDLSFTQPPPRDVTMRMAAERNAIPLPNIDDHAGITLPPAVYQLTRQNFRILNANPAPKRTRTVSASPDKREMPRPPRPLNKPISDVIVIDGAPEPAKSVSTSKVGTPFASNQGPQPMEIVDLVEPAQAATVPETTETNLIGTDISAGQTVPASSPPTTSVGSTPPPPPPSRPSQ